MKQKLYGLLPYFYFYQGVEWMSDYPISFHYMKPEMMYFMEYVMYHARPYGIRQGMEEINKINVF